MNKREFLNKVAELAMQYEESNGNCVVGVDIRFVGTPQYTKNNSFKWDVYSFDGKYMELVDGATDMHYVFDGANMHRYTINTECGLISDFNAINIDVAKSLYSSVYHYDFDNYTDYDGSWYWIIEDNVMIENGY